MSDKPEERRADYLLIGQMAADIRTVKDDVKSVKKTVIKHGEDLAALNVKTGLIGFASGSIATLILYFKLAVAKGGH